MAAKWRVVCVLDFSFLFSLIEEFIYFGELINRYIEKLSSFFPLLGQFGGDWLRFWMCFLLEPSWDGMG